MTSARFLAGRSADSHMSWIDVRRTRSGSPRRISFNYGTIFVGQRGEEFVAGNLLYPGTNGTVFAAHQLHGNGQKLQDCALKLLKLLDGQRIDRFDNEVRIHRDLDHINIASFYGHGLSELGDVDPEEIPWMAMDRCGRNLRQHVDQQGPITGDQFLSVATQICEATKYLHSRSIIHRDIKPANFVWAYDFGTAFDAVKMIGFGIAKYIGEDVSGRRMDQFTQQDEFVGPQNFSSPELLAYARDKRHPIDHRSDLFQVGLLFWFLATGDVSAGVPSKRRDRFGGSLHALVLELLSQEPEDRPQSAQEIIAALKKV